MYASRLCVLCKANRNLVGRHFKSAAVLNKTEVRLGIVKPLSATDATTNKKLAAIMVDSTPTSVQPYLRLMRIDRPVGSWLLFWPCGWGLASAAAPGCLPDPHLLALFAAGAFVMRGAGCTINDMWDRDIDSKVARTSDRPLASKSISMGQATAFLGAQLSCGLLILLQLNWFAVGLGVGSVAIAVTYPVLKRFTNWPQMALGLVMNWGILMADAAINGSLNLPITLPLYVAGISWTIFYDTIYAYQDRKDDLAIGLKSTAIRFGDHPKLWLSGFGSTMVGGLLLSGVMSDQTFPYYTSVGIVGYHLAKQLVTLDVDNVTNCMKNFVSNTQVGIILFCGILLGTLLKKETETQKRTKDEE